MKYGYEVFHADVLRVADFYVRALAFHIESPGELNTQHLTVTRSTLRVGCSHHPNAPTTPRKPPHGCEIVLRVRDVHAEYTRVLDSGWTIEDPLQKRPWGQTDFRVFDPTGQYIRITDGGNRDD